MPTLEVTVSFPLAFAAGVLSFLSPCVLPVVPSYITFVSGMTLDELASGDVAGARRRALVHSIAFVSGFGLVFMTLGAAATAAGTAFAQALPTITRVGGVVVVGFGLYLLGLLKGVPGFRMLSGEHRLHLSAKPAGLTGSVVVGIAFGAGWSPCIGPVLASILLFAGVQGTVLHGTLLLGSYGLGLAVPFVGAAVGFNWFLSGLKGVARRLVFLQRVAGTLLLIVGIMMVTGHFTVLNATLADMGQLFNLDSP